jgi:hypothetical protein
MKLPRRKFLLAAGAAALPAFSRIAWAQAYPTRIGMCFSLFDIAREIRRIVKPRVRF